MQQALEHAKIGKGHTFPNPAVGCLIVQQDTKDVLGAGFHPRAGYPHAEIFALLQAAGHIPDGVEAAKSVVKGTYDENEELVALMEDYIREDGDGPERLFGKSHSAGGHHH